MSKVTVKVDNISKRYRLGVIGTGMLSQDLNIWWARIRGKENPYSTIGDSPAKSGPEDFWALRDISFELREGETMALIGKNGAGKSTLLKILSRITRPTSGEIKIRGRIASLLEVGTGFHEELTGRENIFLNGAILGMSRDAIKNRMDEIIDFTGIEKHIDTPVKRYSTGMYVRLAFAVAAYLDTDILIVDEVLAVGDAEFQKRCLGKMSEAAGQGRTIIFVSHNMQAVANFCEKAIWLEKGFIRQLGKTHEVINNYISNHKQQTFAKNWEDWKTAPGNDKVRFKRIEIIPGIQGQEVIDIRVPLTVRFEFWNLQKNVRLNIEMALFSYSGECVFDVPSLSKIYTAGIVAGECTIPGNFLNDGAYYINLYIMEDTATILYELPECLSFELEDYRGETQYYDKWWGVVRPSFPFSVEQVSEFEFKNIV